jgi:hypothetical protein
MIHISFEGIIPAARYDEDIIFHDEINCVK